MIGTGLRGLSLAEWEYACRFRDYVTLGEPRPDSTGFDRERVAAIERAIEGAFYARRERLRSPRKQRR